MSSVDPARRRRWRHRWLLLLLAASWSVSAASSGGGPDALPMSARASVSQGAGSGTPTLANARAAVTERAGHTLAPGQGSQSAGTQPKPASKARPKARPRRAPARRAPTRPVRELRVTSDVPGAMVFLDRKYLGTTPLVSRDVTPGTHQVNVQVEGRPPVVRTIDIAASGPTELAVTLAAPTALDAAVPVVHQHAAGSCEGTLRATPDGLRYETAHKDAFTVPFAAVETFTVDYPGKRLRVKQRGGRSWTFTTRAETADPLFVFHRDVDAARPR